MFENSMKDVPLNILLADDDLGDCMLFKEALAQIRLFTNLAVVNDGVELIKQLSIPNEPIPDVLFLDLNMPRKTGQECLSEISRNEKLRNLPVIICSTSYIESVAEVLYDKGACYYIQKPVDFEVWVKLIYNALNFIKENLSDIKAGKLKRPAKEHFLLNEPTFH
jgi:CheY-like chemotaxis protein